MHEIRKTFLITFRINCVTVTSKPKMLEYVKENALLLLTETMGQIVERPIDVQWVLTVPAIWSERSKFLMKQWAHRTGIADPKLPDQLLIALEPECAALDVLSRLLVAVELAAIDNSRWEVAWPLTHLPEPPWGRLQSAVKNDESRFATLANPSWVTTVMALKKDLAALHESRRKRPPPKGGQGADP